MTRTQADVLEKPNEAAKEIAAQPANRAYVCPLCGGSEVIHFLDAPDRFHLRREVYRLLRCSTCSGVWQDSPPKPEEMGIHYDEDYHKAIVAAGETSPASRWQRHRDLISRHKQGGAILDIGCSSGAFLGTMKGPSWKLYGIDMENSTAEKARSATGAEVFVGDVMDAPFPPDSFDVITAFDLLEHVYQPRQFLTKVLDWLKPGGIFCTMLPNIDSWESRIFGSYWYGLEMPRHLFHFSPKSLKQVMVTLGFEQVVLSTSEISYVERSMGYVCSKVMENAGFAQVSAAQGKQQSIPWRAVRKAMRITLVRPAGHLASLAGAGASLEAIFRKPASSQGPAQGHRE
jgi:2-polyprenyl-3-methyl-5-hydroxy-6-metoxy-1,4-benzoquinol methylase